MIIGSKYRAFKYDGFEFIIAELPGFYYDKDIAVNLSMKYRKKPVEIEAIQYDGLNNPFEVIESHKCDYRMCTLCGGSNEQLAFIRTLEGGHIVTKNDFVIKGVKGEFYPCKPDVFEMTYDKV